MHISLQLYNSKKNSSFYYSRSEISENCCDKVCEYNFEEKNLELLLN